MKFLITTMSVIALSVAAPAVAQTIDAVTADARAATTAPDRKFLDFPSYDGTDLGVTVANGVTRFALWSPEAQGVCLNLYDTDRNTPAVKRIDMTLTDNGVWRASVPENLTGKFYTFNVRHDGKWLAETPGVWARRSVRRRLSARC